ncbi:MAG TPA: hypothetical protein VHM64_20515, partial [Candidatus Binatia bacterium]|nr:hypothetical protein [Candidatus Binatia bacterium]
MAIAIVLTFGAAYGQSPADSAAPAADLPQASIPLADLVTEAESVAARYRDIRADLSADQSTESVAQRVPAIAREIDGRLRESRRIVAQSPSIEMLRSLEGEWSRLRRELSALNRDLTNRVHELERYMAQLNDFAKRWHPTFDAARQANVPSEVLRHIESVVSEIRQAHEAVEKQRARALTIQSRVGVQDSRIDDALAALDQARDKALDRLFFSDSPPIWRITATAESAHTLPGEVLSSFSRQWSALRAYVERQPTRLVLGVSIFTVLAAALLWMRRRARSVPDTPDRVYPSAPVFEMPLAAALVLSVSGSPWIFPQAPRLLWAVVGVLALAPSIIVARRIVRSDLHRLLYALAGFFFLDQLRTLAAAVQFVPRLLFLAEMLGVIVFSLWLVRAMERLDASAAAGSSRKLIKNAAYLALGIASVAFTANVFGYVTFASLLGNTLLQSSYLALFLYAAVEILDGLIAFGLGMPPFAALGTISRYRALVSHRLRRILQWLAVLIWLLAVLQWLLLRDRLFAAA